MLALSSSYELATTYLQVFLLWMFCSERVLSFACVYFVITGHFLPVWGLSIYSRTSHPLKKVRLEKSGSLYLGIFVTLLVLMPFDVFWGAEFENHLSLFVSSTVFNVLTIFVLYDWNCIARSMLYVVVHFHT